LPRSLAEADEELCRRENADASCREPGPELLIFEQVGVARHDRLGAAGQGRGDDGSIARIADLDIDVDRREQGAKEKEQLVHGVLSHGVSDELRTRENAGELLRQLP
jgi:hypothetical protein